MNRCQGEENDDLHARDSHHGDVIKQDFSEAYLGPGKDVQESLLQPGDDHLRNAKPGRKEKNQAKDTVGFQTVDGFERVEARAYPA